VGQHRGGVFVFSYVRLGDGIAGEFSLEVWSMSVYLD
jgi:hypothetical protein